MAMYHFTIKTDKKPDGTKVSALTHTEYINRENKYKDYDLKDEIFKQNFNNTISIDTKDTVFNDKKMLLYHSPFGDIIHSNKGISISDNASMETIAIALAIASKIYKKDIMLKGSTTFEASVVLAANNMELPVVFANKILDENFRNIKKEQKYGQDRTGPRRTSKNIGTIRNTTNKSQYGIKQAKGKTIKTITTRGFNLRTLSECGLVYSPEDTDMLLPGDADSIIYDERQRSIDTNMRWDVSRLRGIAAKKTADLILNNVIHQMDNVFASSHAEYINREAAFKKRGGCIYKKHHLPNWANDSPKSFFAAADRYEGVGNTRYKEIEFALPNELKLDQQKEIIEKFVETHLKDFYYAYAVHDKIGAMSNGEHNTHVHIMFSERKIDDAEKEKERSASKFFAYPFRNPKSLDDKRKGGAPKDRKWGNKNRAKYLALMREDFALIQNEVLAKYDIPVRVDHRSLKAQRDEALKNGDMLLAKILDRLPEEAIGPSNALRKNNPKVQKLKKYREYKSEYQKLLYAAEILEQSIAEEKYNAAIHNNTELLKKFENTDTIPKLKEELLTALKKMNALKSMVIYPKQAQEAAKLKFMNSDEKEIYQKFKKLTDQKNHWEIFKKNIQKPTAIQQDELKTYNELIPELDKKIAALDKEITSAAKEIKPIYEKLSSARMIINIQKEVHQILFDDRETKKEIELENKKISQLTMQMENILIDVNQKNIVSELTAKDVYKIINSSYLNLKNEYDKSIENVKRIYSRVISKKRAIAMAKDLYTKNATKKLREEFRSLVKKEKYLKNDIDKFSLEKQEYYAISPPKFWNSNSLKEKYKVQTKKINNMETVLKDRQNELLAIRKNLENKEVELNSICNTSEAKSKINTIALGILRKNQPIVIKHQTLINDIKIKYKNIKHIELQLKGLKKQISIDNAEYKIVNKLKATNTSGSNNSSFNKNTGASIIADAILGDSGAAKLVAKSSGKNEMDKDWQMMTAIEKDEKEMQEVFKI
ncbi:MobA/MobL family protein [Pectinatus frisingensis]|uniref:MobA/MobL family protein n=1 Tax=Pectinatus frisingensis TaxID=865 RepID=UPI003D803387